jgi:DedD protein
VERAVKERLVGAAVLMAAAIILIPEMLSGPDREPSDSEARSEAAAPKGDSSLKTYTIDLSQSPGARASTETVDSRMPPPEQNPTPPPSVEPPAVRTQAIPEPAPQQQPAAQTAAPPVSLPVEQAPKPSVVERPSVATAESRPPPARPLAPAADAPTSGAWAVQLGSFSKQVTAERLVKELRAQGHNAFVMPVQSDASTLFRVRIGPMTDKASAEAVLQDVKATVPGAAVVTHR